MKSVTLVAVACGSIGSACGFTVDFSAFTVGDSLNPDLVVNVPGYGNVRFTEAPGNNENQEGPATSSLEITDEHSNEGGVIRNSIGFENGEQMLVTFEAAQVVYVNFDYAGIGAGEQFTVNTTNGEPGPFIVSFAGNSAGIIAVSFDVIPEPGTTMLCTLAGLGLVGFRRR